LNTITPVGIQRFRFSLKGEERERTRKNDFSFLRDGERGKEIFLIVLRIAAAVRLSILL
jgi:hypothetical protein